MILQELAAGGHADSSGALRDSLGIGSPRNAVQCAQTMIRSLTWLQIHVSNRNPWDRLKCLQCLQPDGHGRTSASRGMAFSEAFRFLKYVLGIPIPEQLWNDPQLKGRAQRITAGKASYNHARAFKVSELAILETSMQKHVDPILLTRPLRLYGSMLENICCGHFRPDESRTSKMVDLLKISSHECDPLCLLKACGRQADGAHFELITGGCSTLSADAAVVFEER